jgi:D-glycero-alpha-D-manno-heptose-7-phosphate kinase
MIISRTPYRLSLFGGGTDYPPWFRAHGGAVLGFAIDKYCYISVRRLPPFFEHRSRIVYSRIEMVRHPREIEHPAARAVLQDQGFEDEGLEIHHDGDIPARSGVGSSSSFTVGLLNALAAFRGRHISKEDLARTAIRIEQDVIGENVGSQDQVWAAYGGMNRIDFDRNGGFQVSPLILPASRQAELMSHMMLFFTGLSRNASDVAGQKIANLQKRADDLRRMRAMVDDATAILADTTRPIADLGPLLDEGWRLKRGLAERVSTGTIDEIYAEGMAAGAVGGKLLGAGGGGFVAFLVPPARQAAVRERLRKLVQVDVDIDHAGSTIVVYEPRGFGRRAA